MNIGVVFFGIVLATGIIENMIKSNELSKRRLARDIVNNQANHLASDVINYVVMSIGMNSIWERIIDEYYSTGDMSLFEPSSSRRIERDFHEDLLKNLKNIRILDDYMVRGMIAKMRNIDEKIFRVLMLAREDNDPVLNDSLLTMQESVRSLLNQSESLYTPPSPPPPPTSPPSPGLPVGYPLPALAYSAEDLRLFSSALTDVIEDAIQLQSAVPSNATMAIRRFKSYLRREAAPDDVNR